MCMVLLLMLLAPGSAGVLRRCQGWELQKLCDASKPLTDAHHSFLQVKCALQQWHEWTPGDRARAYIHTWSPHGDPLHEDLVLDMLPPPRLNIPQVEGSIEQVRSWFRATGKPSLCGLTPNGSLVDEATAFLDHSAGSSELAHSLESMWVDICSATSNTSDVDLLNALRGTVRVYTEFTTTWQPTSTSGSTIREQLAITSGNPSDDLTNTADIETRSDECIYEDELLRLLELNSSSVRVMDYGSGSGSRLVTYKMCEIGHRNVGVDVQDVRTDKAKKSFDFMQLEDPYVDSFASTITERQFDGAFDLVLSDVTFHHIGSEDKIRATAAQLGRVLKDCGAFVLSEWDNDVDMASGHPDLTPLWDLVHTYSQTLCLPWVPPQKTCAGNLTSADLHKMWEGAATAYFSRARYQEIMLHEAGLTLVRTYRNTLNTTIDQSNWRELLHPFVQVFMKGSECKLAR